MKRKLQIVLAVLLLVTFAGLAIYGVIHNRQKIHIQNIQLESKDFKLQQIESQFKEINSKYEQELDRKDSDQQKLKEYEDKIHQLESNYKALEVSKAAEKAEQQRLANAAPHLSATASAAGRCGENALAAKIFMQESSCVLDRVNGIGCIGLGQSCPQGGVPPLARACPDWRTNYDCQWAFWNNYAMSYGSWDAAYSFKYCTGVCYSTRTKINTNKGSEIWW